MNCHLCKDHLPFEEAFKRMKSACHVIDIPQEFTLPYALNQHRAFSSNIQSLVDHRKLKFFKRNIADRPVLLHSFSNWYLNDSNFNLCHRQMISVVELQVDHVHQNCQMLLWIVTRPEVTMMSDGTIYLLVHDVHYFTIRLVIRNWSYFVPIDGQKSTEMLNRIIDDLFPLNDLIVLLDPCLTECLIDGQRTICCDAPNLQLILIERVKRCFVDESLDELRRRGNDAFSRGEIQLSIDFYTFAMNRLATMASSLFGKKNDGEFGLFTNAFQTDLCRFYSNRSAAFLREHLYGNASMDSIIVTTVGFFDDNIDESLIKCLYRLICSHFGLNQLKSSIEMFFLLAEKALANFHFKQIYFEDFQRLRIVFERLKDETERGMFDMKTMFNIDPFRRKCFFDLDVFYGNFQNKVYIKKRRGIYQAKNEIPVGSLIIVQQPFVFVPIGNDNDEEHRLLNAVERHLNLSTKFQQFEMLRQIPSINRWLEDETDAEPNDSKTFPETIPHRILVKAQKETSLKSKQLIGWWPEASNFQSTKEKENLFWFIAGKTLVVFNYLTVKKNDQLVFSRHQTFQFFEQHQNLRLLTGSNRKLCLKDLFDDLKRTQDFIDNSN